MIHRHRRIEHDHLNDYPGHRHHGGDNYWAPTGCAPSGQRDEGEYHFVPGEVLVDAKEYERSEVRDLLTRYEFLGPDRGWPEPAPPKKGPDPVVPGMVTVRMDAPPGSFHRLEVPDIIDSVRRSRPDAAGAQVAPNHVLFGAFHNMWGPGTLVEKAAAAPFKRFPKKGPGAGVKIAVLDTGIVKHPLLKSFDPGAYDLPDEDMDKKLDYEAGHGVFIEGIILRYAPAAEVVHKRVLTSNGNVDDASLAARLSECADADIVNLSLGGYTHDNRGLYALPRVLDSLRAQKPDLVVVAAAGNDHTDRPFYPAASKGVIAVAAHADPDVDGRADYSNFGWWVDARAKGTHVSTFYDPAYGGDDGTLTAPFGKRLADFAGWARWAGTSFAAPVVVGAIAARMTGRPQLTAKEAARRLLDEAGPTQRQGLGVLIEPRDYAEGS